MKLREPFLSNSFLTLGLAATATAEEIRQQAGRLELEARLATSTPVRNEELVRARTELLDPSRRIPQEVLWFYSPEADLLQGRFTDRDAILGSYRARARGVDEDGIRNSHDAAAWLLVRAVHTEDPTEAEEATVRALVAFSDLLENPFYARYLVRHGGGGEAAAVKKAWDAVIRCLVQTGQARAEEGDAEGALSIVRGTRRGGVSDDHFRRLAEATVQPVVARARAIFEASSANDIGNADVDDALANGRRLIDAVDPLAEAREHFGGLVLPELNRLLDEAAQFLHQQAVKIHEAGRTEEAEELVEAALEIAASRQLGETLTSELTTIRSILSSGPAFEVINRALEVLKTADSSYHLNYRLLEDAGEDLASHLEGWEEDDEARSGVLPYALRVLRAIAVRLHNDFQKTGIAAEFVQLCVDYSAEAGERAGYETDHEVLLYQVHIQAALDLAKSERWAEAEAEALAAVASAQTNEDRLTAQRTAAVLASRRSQSGPLGWIFSRVAGLVGSVGVLIIIGLVIAGISAVANCDQEESGLSSGQPALPASDSSDRQSDQIDLPDPPPESALTIVGDDGYFIGETIYIEGRVRNSSNWAATSVVVEVELYDRLGNLISTERDNIGTVGPNASKPYSVSTFCPRCDTYAVGTTWFWERP